MQRLPAAGYGDAGHGQQYQAQQSVKHVAEKNRE
jgi:hypothetical protein